MSYVPFNVDLYERDVMGAVIGLLFLDQRKFDVPRIPGTEVISRNLTIYV